MPLAIYKWPGTKTDNENEIVSDPLEHLEDNMTKKSDDKSSKKGTNTVYATALKSPGSKETRPSKKTSVTHHGNSAEDLTAVQEDYFTPETPKTIVLATISPLHATRMSSFGETADRSERLRHYNLNEIFSTSVLLTTVRDIPLDPPPPPSPSSIIPAWKLIRPRKPVVLPHAEPIGTIKLHHKSKEIIVFI